MDRKGFMLHACMWTQLIPLLYWLISKNRIDITLEENIYPQFLELLAMMGTTLASAYVLAKFILRFRAIREKIGVE